MKTILVFTALLSFVLCALPVVDICQPVKCPPPKIWSPKACSCVCPNVCTGNNIIQNPKTCACECAQSLKCQKLQVFDPRLCKCVCKNEILCLAPFVLNPDSCSCTCPFITCPVGQIQSLKDCKCGKPVVAAIKAAPAAPA